MSSRLSCQELKAHLADACPKRAQRPLRAEARSSRHESRGPGAQSVVASCSSKAVLHGAVKPDLHIWAKPLQVGLVNCAT